MGSTYAMSGHMQKITDGVFLFTPDNYESSARGRQGAVDEGIAKATCGTTPEAVGGDTANGARWGAMNGRPRGDHQCSAMGGAITSARQYLLFVMLKDCVSSETPSSTIKLSVRAYD